MALKYNPLLKLNLQEETSAEEVLGDGYNEKLLTFNDFVTDCQTILTDTGEIRKYLFSGWSVNLPANLNCNFSCEINFLPITSGNFIINAPKFKGRYVKLFGVHLDGLTDINCQEFILQCCSIRSRGGLIFSNNCLIKIIDCPVENFYSSTWQISVSKRSVISVINSNFNYKFINPNLISLYTDGSVTLNNNQQAQFIKYINIDSALDINSRGLLPNSVITAALQALQPDAALDPDSSKPVMNSAVTQEINTITQIIENFQDINVANLTEFENAIQTGQNANVRIHLTTDITLTQSVTYNLDKIEIYGHDNKINLENFTFTIAGATCNFYQVRFNANSAVTASSASNYSNAQIIIKASEASTRYFFEYVIFMNFICQSSDNLRNIINISANSGLSTPSAHLYFMFCEVMTKYVSSNINNCVVGIYHSGGENGQIKFHALTAHNIDFWGNALEDNSCGNWSFTGNSLTGLAKLGWISDGSSTYKIVTNSLTPSFTNQYNPSYSEFLTLKNSFSFQTYNDLKVNSYTSSQVQCYTTVYYNNYIAIVKFFTVGSGNIPPGAFSNKISIKLIDSLQLDSNVQVNAEADGFTLISVNQTAPGMFGTFTMPILQN